MCAKGCANWAAGPDRGMPADWLLGEAQRTDDVFDGPRAAPMYLNEAGLRTGPSDGKRA